MQVHPGVFVSSTSTDAWRADPEVGGGAEEHVLVHTGTMRAGLTRFGANADPGPLCWVLPQTYSWARLWFSTFFATVFAQSIQVLVLQLGTELIEQLPTLFPSSAGSDAVDRGRLWLVSLLFGVAVLQLARKVPRLMPGYPGGGGAAGAAGIGSVRQITSLIRLAASRGSSR